LLDVVVGAGFGVKPGIKWAWTVSESSPLVAVFRPV
jgi:hypothetical protein